MTLVTTASSVVPPPQPREQSEVGHMVSRTGKLYRVGCVAGRGKGQGSWHSEQEKKAREHEWPREEEVVGQEAG